MSWSVEVASKSKLKAAEAIREKAADSRNYFPDWAAEALVQQVEAVIFDNLTTVVVAKSHGHTDFGQGVVTQEVRLLTVGP